MAGRGQKARGSRKGGGKAVRKPAPQHSLHTCLYANARQLFYNGIVHNRFSLIRKPARSFVKWRVSKAPGLEHSDAEQRATAPYCKGRGLDIGCGSKKTVPSAIGVDLTPKGQYGFAGSQLFEASQADIATSGDDLHMFKDAELDYIVARHNLEHYQDPIKTLQEWRRVLKPGGTLILTLPDDEFANTIALDPTHYHVYTRESLARLINIIGGFKIIRNEPMVPKLSFILVAKKA